MARIAKPSEQFDPVHAGQVGIDDEASFAAWMEGLQEVLACRVILDDPAILLEHAADSLADVTVVINDEDDGWLVAPCLLIAARGTHARSGLRCCQETLDRPRQFRQLHRFVQLNTVLKCNVTQGAGRDITGQNDGRYRSMKFLSQLCDELDSVQAIGKTVVSKYEIGPNRAACHQIQRCDAVARCCRTMTFAFKGSLKKFAHLRIIVDDKDLADAVRRCNGLVVHPAAAMCRPRYRSAGREHDLDGEDRTFARQRADVDPMAKQIAQALYDSET